MKSLVKIAIITLILLLAYAPTRGMALGAIEGVQKIVHNATGPDGVCGSSSPASR